MGWMKLGMVAAFALAGLAFGEALAQGEEMARGEALVQDKAMAEEDGVAAAKAALFKRLAEYRPGAPVGEELTGRIDAAAAELERAAGGPPDLRANLERLTGQWVSLFSSQGVVGEIEVRFMTRALPGGGHAGGTALSQVVLQELRPAERFYRNMMTMLAGEPRIPLLHVATASVDVAEDAPNFLEVRFRRIEFLPGRADVTLEQLRDALALPEEAPLAVDVPMDLSKPASRSEVTYLDDDLRINRGKNYVAILRKVR